jgi:hypothetical protein
MTESILKIGQIRRPVADSLEVVDGKFHFGRPRHGEKMKHGVCRTTKDWDIQSTTAIIVLWDLP